MSQIGKHLNIKPIKKGMVIMKMTISTYPAGYRKVKLVSLTNYDAQDVSYKYYLEGGNITSVRVNNPDSWDKLVLELLLVDSPNKQTVRHTISNSSAMYYFTLHWNIVQYGVDPKDPNSIEAMEKDLGKLLLEAIQTELEFDMWFKATYYQHRYDYARQAYITTLYKSVNTLIDPKILDEGPNPPKVNRAADYAAEFHGAIPSFEEADI